MPTMATTQVRMMAQPRQTTITRHGGPVRIQGPINVAPGGAVGMPRMINTTVSQIRGTTTIVQQGGNMQLQSNPPALHPVSQATFAPGGAQVSAFLSWSFSFYSSIRFHPVDSSVRRNNSPPNGQYRADSPINTRSNGDETNRCGA